MYVNMYIDRSSELLLNFRSHFKQKKYFVPYY